jgi:cytochrome c553
MISLVEEDALQSIALAVLVSILAAATPAHGAEDPPQWAYPVNPPGFKPPPDDGTIRRVPGSSVGYTLTQTRDRFLSPDWHPADYPARPEIVARGRKPDVYACGFCHRADGPGGPENANLTGLPADYIVQQMMDFKTGARKGSVRERQPMQLKAEVAKSVTEPELRSAADYFSSIPPRSIVRVIESATAPKTFITGSHLAAVTTGETEPLGERIIEVPDDLEQFVSRDTRARFTAYVPVGSVDKGRSLAADGGAGKTVQCGPCHGADMKGAGTVPGIAGRSPSYLFRQLYDFKQTTRAGAGASLMKPSVENLSVEDMLNLAAYAASLAP